MLRKRIICAMLLLSSCAGLSMDSDSTVSIVPKCNGNLALSGYVTRGKNNSRECYIFTGNLAESKPFGCITYYVDKNGIACFQKFLIKKDDTHGKKGKPCSTVAERKCRRRFECLIKKCLLKLENTKFAYLETIPDLFLNKSFFGQEVPWSELKKVVGEDKSKCYVYNLGILLGAYQQSSYVPNQWSLFLLIRKKPFCTLTLERDYVYKATMKEDSEQNLDFSFRAESVLSAAAYVLDFTTTTTKARMQTHDDSTEEVL